MRFWCLVLLCFCWSGAAFAGAKEDAKAKRKEGDALLASGDYNAALRAYEEGQALVPDPLFSLSRAEVLRKLRRYSEAKDAYEEFTKKAKSAKQKQDAEFAIDFLEAILETSVVCESFPVGASVYLDSRADGFVGVAPVTLQASPGPHRIIFELEGHTAQEVEVFLERGKVTPLQVDLPSPKMILSLDSNPSGAAVLIDGVPQGNTPLRVEREAGAYVITFSLDEHGTRKETLRGRPGEEVSFTALLARRERSLLWLNVPEGIPLSISVDGLPILLGTGIPLETGKHVLRAEAPEYDAIEREFSFSKEKGGTMSIALEPLPRNAKLLGDIGLGMASAAGVTVATSAFLSAVYFRNDCNTRFVGGCSEVREAGQLSVGLALTSGVLSAGLYTAKFLLQRKTKRSSIDFIENP